MNRQVVILLILLMTGATLLAPAHQVSASAMPQVIPDASSLNLTQTIHAYAVGNLTATQEPGYTYAGLTSPMPSNIIIIAQAPGNATVSVYYNDTILTDSSGQRIYNTPFTGQISISANLPTTESDLVITVSSAALNLSATFTYKLNVLSVTQFIQYEYNVHNVQYPGITYTLATYWANIVEVVIVIVASIFIVMYIVPLRWRNRKFKKGDN